MQLRPPARARALSPRAPAHASVAEFCVGRGACVCDDGMRPSLWLGLRQPLGAGATRNRGGAQLGRCCRPAVAR